MHTRNIEASFVLKHYRCVRQIHSHWSCTDLACHGLQLDVHSNLLRVSKGISAASHLILLSQLFQEVSERVLPAVRDVQEPILILVVLIHCGHHCRCSTYRIVRERVTQFMRCLDSALTCWAGIRTRSAGETIVSWRSQDRYRGSNGTHL